MLTFRNAALRPVIEEARKKGCSVVFVVDDGIYMRSDFAVFKDGKPVNLAYAEGFTPSLNPNWQVETEKLFGKRQLFLDIDSSYCFFSEVMDNPKADLQANPYKWLPMFSVVLENA